MCYTRKDHQLEEEARSLQAEEKSRRRREKEGRREEDREKKPLTEKLLETVGVR